MPDNPQTLDGVIEAWNVIEALADLQYDLAGIDDLAQVLDIHPARVRRILGTWIEIGLVEKRGSLYRLSSYLAYNIPNRLKLALAEKLRALDKIGPETD